MIPVSKPCLSENDIDAAVLVLKSGWISSLGSELRLFEKEFANYVGVKHVASCSNGTTAIQLALSAIGIERGDEVIIPELTFAAVANAVMAVGAKPICVDVCHKTWNINENSINSALTDKSKALIVVHSYGNPVDVKSIKKRFPKLFIIEDCAEAHGAEVNGQKVGSLGDIGTFSFYANKIITTGEGGCLTTDNQEIYNRITLLRDHGMDPDVRYFHIAPGFNYRLTNIQGALGLSQLKYLEKFIEERDFQTVCYDETLIPLGFRAPAICAQGKAVNWLYTRLVPDGMSRDGLIRYLKECGVETRPMFKPISSFKYVQDLSGNKLVGQHSKHLSDHGISLPTFNGLSIHQIVYIKKCVKEYVFKSNYN